MEPRRRCPPAAEAGALGVASADAVSRGIARLLLVLGLLAASVALPTSAGAAGVVRGELGLSRLATGAVVPNSYVVSLRSGDSGEVAAEHARWGARIQHVFRAGLLGYSARMSASTARRIAHDPRVRKVTADRVVRAASQAIPTGARRVHAPAARERAESAPVGPVRSDIAVLDTGIDLTHPDLNVAGGVDCVPGTTSYDDTRGHGTHIAGLAAAKDNGHGVVGVAPGARVWAVRVLDSAGDGSLATLICGIDWVTDHAATIKVANMSLVGHDPDQGCSDGALHEAICKSVAAGVVYTVAAGNDHADASGEAPASYPEVITVGALADYDGLPGGLAKTPAGCPDGGDDEFANFSNYGAKLALIAPGACLRSTWIDHGYAILSGTSQAAALVAGAVALYRSEHPAATPTEVREALIAAGSDDWKTSSAPDRRDYPLLDVTNF